jgi:hypothetical protein
MVEESTKRLKEPGRHFRRILRSYHQEAGLGLVSRKRGQVSNRKKDKETLKKVIEFICDPHKIGFFTNLYGKKAERYVRHQTN